MQPDVENTTIPACQNLNFGTTQNIQDIRHQNQHKS